MEGNKIPTRAIVTSSVQVQIRETYTYITTELIRGNNVVLEGEL